MIRSARPTQLPDDGVPDASGLAAVLFGPDPRSRRVRALLVLAAGIALGIIGAAQHILLYSIKHEPMFPARILAAELLEWVLWCALVPVIFWLDARSGFRRPGWRRAAVAHAALLLAFLLLQNGVMTAVNFLVDPTLRQAYASLYVPRSPACRPRPSCTAPSSPSATVCASSATYTGAGCAAHGSRPSWPRRACET